MADTEIVAEFAWERHAFINNGGESRTIIGDAVTADEQEIVVRGEAQEGELKSGLEYRFFGRWREHPKYGNQFVFKSFVLQDPVSENAVIVYLRQCRGIGYATAKSIWEQYGTDSVAMLREQPEAVAESTKGLTVEKAEAAACMLQRMQYTERAKMDVLSLLFKQGFPKKTVDLVLKDYGADAANRIRRNPFLLMQYHGVGFAVCDKLWMKLQKPPQSLKRQALCGIYCVSRSSNGDTWHPRKTFTNGVERQIAGAEVRGDKALELAIRSGRVVEDNDHGQSLIALSNQAWQEGVVARFAAQVMTEHRINAWPNVSTMSLTGHQRDEAAKALDGRLGILGGSPGTGKSYSTAEIVKAVTKCGWKLDDIAVAAPTGKAAVRVTEAMHTAGLPCAARTVHSLLVVQATSAGGYDFLYDDRLPMPYKFIFVDEASMLDVPLAQSFLRAVGSDSRVLLIGDINQLPPVGHGAPLKDLIAAGIPYGELTEVRRNSGRIVRACAEIRDHKRFTASKSLDLPNGENLIHIEKPNAVDQIDILDHLLVEFRNGQEYDPIWDVQVLVPLNKKGDVSRKKLNARIQMILNGNGERGENNPFRVRDKIINLKNGWFPALEPGDPAADAEGRFYVANGEQAEVCVSEPNRTVAKLTNPDRLIVIPRGQVDPDEDEMAEGDTEGDGPETNTGCSWDLGYAISVHKSQGSEWPVCLVIVDESGGAKRVQTRNWFYTAISRAKSFCITIGQRSIINDMMYRDGVNRKTLLVERVADEMAKVRRRRAAESVKSWGRTEWSEIFNGVL